MTPGSPVFTPDRRYIIVRDRLWRAANPALTSKARQALTRELMSARRAVAAAGRSGRSAEMKAARARVQAAKVALGERGPVWWSDGSPDYNRYMVKNTPYASWYASLMVRRRKRAQA